jgi:hypothetical protein
MAYAHYVKTDESKRMAAISRRTLDAVLTDRRPLTEPELLMLGQLDPLEVSRFAHKYFLLLDDMPMASSGVHRLGGRPSRFGMICVPLASEGTKDALPGLTDAIAKGIFLPPTYLAPYRLHWLAAFSIAARDPWPDVDKWLASQIGSTEALIDGRPSSAVVGATAAALLLKRHGRTPAPFNLQPAADPLLLKLHVDGYRFSDEQSPKKIQAWWAEVKKK